MQMISLLFIPYSKSWKQGQKVVYWMRKMSELNNRSDEGAVMDSHDEFDHGSAPGNLTSWVIEKTLRLVFVIFCQGYQAC